MLYFLSLKAQNNFALTKRPLLQNIPYITKRPQLQNVPRSLMLCSEGGKRQENCCLLNIPDYIYFLSATLLCIVHSFKSDLRRLF